MTRRRPRKAFEALARSIARSIKPGTIKGVRADGSQVDEAAHFYTCKQCGGPVDKRDLGQVFHHEMSGHERLPEN